MGFSPSDCIVVEDSNIGIQAANAEGMRALQYAPHSTEKCEKKTIVFNRMSRLPHLIKSIEASYHAILPKVRHPRFDGGDG